MGVVMMMIGSLGGLEEPVHEKLCAWGGLVTYLRPLSMVPSLKNNGTAWIRRVRVQPLVPSLALGWGKAFIPVSL